LGHWFIEPLMHWRTIPMDQWLNEFND